MNQLQLVITPLACLAAGWFCGFVMGALLVAYFSWRVLRKTLVGAALAGAMPKPPVGAAGRWSPPTVKGGAPM